MLYPIEFRSELTTRQLADLAQRFEALKTPGQLSQLLGVNEATLQKIAAKQEYFSFHIPKPGGERRLIQHPAPPLKNLQQILNRYLQAVYYNIRTDCAYAFIVRPADELRPRNIYFNALRHHKGEWFLNVDLSNFFHTISTTHLRDLFRQTFCFPPDLVQVLVQLCTYQSRLPMGAPTSPALSNLVCLFFDYQLQYLADRHKATFTRYADDLTFSFSASPPPDFLEEIRALVLKFGFSINEKKLRLQGRLEQPEITGLIVGRGEKPTLSKNWLKRLKQEIKILEWLTSEATRERGLFHAWTFDRFRQSVRGQIEFVGFVAGKNDRIYRKLAARAGV